MQRRPRSGAPPKVYPPTVVLSGAQLGTDVVVGAFCFVASGAVVGAGTRIQSHTSIWDGVVLGEDVFVGPGAQFTNMHRARAAFPRSPNWEITIVEDGATVGANATLVAPVRVGKYAVIGAGAVVTHEVPANGIVVGNPARVVGWACECGESIARGERRPTRAKCNVCGRVLE
jgi:UDP-2-acetamido-3-amino-2,3-dideoxy-glucuronate N-acetyltransferase